MFRSKRLLGLCLMGAVAAPLPPWRTAQAEEQSRIDVEALKKEAASGDEKRILQALTTVEESKDPAAAPVIQAVLERGGTTTVLQAALRAAGKLKVPSLSASVAPYIRHRTPEVRQAAASALLQTGGPEAIQTLTRALRSSDPMVRGIAATGLGSLGARESLEDLFRAFDHDVAEAAASIGLLCGPEQCERFVALMGKKPFDVMVSGLDQILFRPPKDISDEQKIGIIGRIRELGTAEVAKYLADAAGRWPKDWSPKVKASFDAGARAARGTK
jgi:hypothetical protein